MFSSDCRLVLWAEFRTEEKLVSRVSHRWKEGGRASPPRTFHEIHGPAAPARTRALESLRVRLRVPYYRSQVAGGAGWGQLWC